jgi:hypothetical protein
MVHWSIAMNKKPTVGFLFFVLFPSDRTLKVTEDVNVQFLIHSSNAIPVNCISKFWELFDVTTYNVTTKNLFQH